MQVIKEQNAIETWVHRWGGAISEAALNPDAQFFQTPGKEGGIGYRLQPGHAIVLGDPICPKEEIPELTQAFAQYCQEKGLSIVYLATSESFSKWAIQGHCKILLEVGQEFIFNPQNNILETTKANRLRNKISHATKIGLTAHEYLDKNPNLERSFQEVAKLWEKGRSGPQMSLGPIHFFDTRDYRRWFYIKNQNQILGAALLCQLETRNGWLLKFMVTIPEAPRGTSELLMIFILDTLKEENCSFLTYGMIPTDHLGETIGLGSFKNWLTNRTFNAITKLFKLNQRRTYWKKFDPYTEPLYVLFVKPQIGFRAIKAITSTLKNHLTQQ